MCHQVSRSSELRCPFTCLYSVLLENNLHSTLGWRVLNMASCSLGLLSLQHLSADIFWPRGFTVLRALIFFFSSVIVMCLSNGFHWSLNVVIYELILSESRFISGILYFHTAFQSSFWKCCRFEWNVLIIMWGTKVPKTCLGLLPLTFFQPH